MTSTVATEPEGVSPERHSRGRVAGLDLIRGIAIALVMIRHGWPETFGGAGIAGVVLFFALSGYLIAGLLLGDIDRSGRVRYGRFYAHRALRLIPPLVALLIGYVVVTLTWNPLGEHGLIRRSLLVALTYTADITGFDHGSLALNHLWTLAIEEQFYLLWPAILTLAVLTRTVALTVAVLAAGLMAWCALAIHSNSAYVEAVYTQPQSWAVVMVIGAAARIWHEPLAATVFATPRRRRTLGLLAVAALAVIALAPQIKGAPSTYLVLGPCIGVCGIALIFWLRGVDGAAVRSVAATVGAGHDLVRVLPLEFSDATLGRHRRQSEWPARCSDHRPDGRCSDGELVPRGAPHGTTAPPPRHCDVVQKVISVSTGRNGDRRQAAPA